VKRAVVTGGGGFIGKAIVKQLLALGIETIVVGRHHYADVGELGATICQGDIRDQTFLTGISKNCDTVFHVAAKAGIWGNRKDYFSINVTGTENVIAACKQNKVPTLVYTSTPSVVFDGASLGGGDESLPYAKNFLCHYAETKMLAEKKILAANCQELTTTAIRPHLVWGPGDTNLIPRLVDRGRRGQLKQVGSGDNLVDISYIDNVAEAHILAADNLATKRTAAGRAYFISQGEPVKLWQWINAFLAMVSVPPVSKKISFEKARFAGSLLEKIYALLRLRQEPLMTRFVAEQLAHSHWFSIAAARRDLGYQPTVSIAEGMARTADWVLHQ